MYGAFIVDPKKPRPEADELILIMNGFDTNFDADNEVYAVNTLANHYAVHPIRVEVGRLVRMHVINVTEFDLINSLHLHGMFFDVFRTGTRLTVDDHTDTVMMCQGERVVLETRFRYPESSCSTRIRASSLNSAGWACSKRWRHKMASNTNRARLWVGILLPIVLLAGILALMVRFSPADQLKDPAAPPIENVLVRRIVLNPDGLVATVFNQGPDAVTIAQVTIDDAYWQFAADPGLEIGPLRSTTLTIPYPWVAGEAHHVAVLSSTGTKFEYEIPVALQTPEPAGRQFLILAGIGLFVGVMPVALGLLWFPVVRRLSSTGIDAVLAFTIGLLLVPGAGWHRGRTGIRRPAARVVPGHRALRPVRRGSVRRARDCWPVAVWPKRRGRRGGLVRLDPGGDDCGRHRAAQFQRGPGDQRRVRAWERRRSARCSSSASRCTT